MYITHIFINAKRDRLINLRTIQIPMKSRMELINIFLDSKIKI